VFTDPLQQGSHEEVGSNASSVTDDDYYQNILGNFKAQSVLADEKLKRLLGFYADQFGIRPRNVLEFGCGTGQYASGWAKQGISWAGVEASPRMIEFCRARGCNVMEASEVPKLPSRTFDLVYFSQVLEHVLDPRTFLQEVYRLLAHGGIVHLDVPNHDSLAATLRKLNPRSSDYGFIQPPHHLIAYTRRSLSAVTSAAGFSTRYMEAVPNNHPVLGQLMVLQRPLHRVLMAIDSALGTGSLLVAILEKAEAPANSFKANLPHG
jgi:SAM-dependent methyltransferase